nr:MAG TPA: hypothetical protein [Caudoviricetes sp.]
MAVPATFRAAVANARVPLEYPCGSDGRTARKALPKVERERP